MRFHDRGFIYKYQNFTQVQVFNVGNIVLDMKIYKDKVCTSTFRCQDIEIFNKENLHQSYKKEFLKELFDADEKQTIFRDDENRILIKILRD